MGWHVANYHLNLAQLWLCPVSWCTQWKTGLCRTPLSGTRGASYREGGELSERGAPLIHHYWMFVGASAHVSLCGSYMIKLRAFAAEAAARWARHRDLARPAVTTTSAHPREVRQRDTDINLPHRKILQPCHFLRLY